MTRGPIGSNRGGHNLKKSEEVMSWPARVSGFGVKGRTRITALPSLEERCRGGSKGSRENDEGSGETHGDQRVRRAFGLKERAVGCLGREETVWDRMNDSGSIFIRNRL